MTNITVWLPLVSSVLLVLVTLALVIQIGKLRQTVNTALARSTAPRPDAERTFKELRRDELAQVKSDVINEIKSLRSAMGSIAADMQRLVAKNAAPQPAPRPVAVFASEVYEAPPRSAEDGVAQLVSIANRTLVSSTSFDAFCTSASSVSSRISPYPSSQDGSPIAFIVEYRGSFYAVPNVVKPARFPQAWFNRSEFGVNDEIRRVVSLPRLRRAGDDYDVIEPGEFAK